jgi:hypothetical protein
MSSESVTTQKHCNIGLKSTEDLALTDIRHNYNGLREQVDGLREALDLKWLELIRCHTENGNLLEKAFWHLSHAGVQRNITWN